MPLSEEEQRVFAEIERQLVADAPRRALRRRRARRRGGVLAPTAGLFVSLLVAAFGVAVHPLLVVAAFLGAVLFCVVIVHALGNDRIHADEAELRSAAR